MPRTLPNERLSADIGIGTMRSSGSRSAALLVRALSVEPGCRLVGTSPDLGLNLRLNLGEMLFHE
jgi:hypothetical protein